MEPTLKEGERFPVDKLDPKPEGRAVVYFYPRDDTPGCTLEAHRFNELYDDFRSAGYEVIGVSVDSAESHAAFAEKCGLRFPLSVDTDMALTRELGIVKEKEGHVWSARTTFLLDDDGTVQKVWSVTDAGAHPDEVLAAVQT